MIKHSVVLKGAGTKGISISAITLQEVLNILVEGTKESLRFRIEGRSTARGAEPAWLIRASDFDIVGFSAGSTVIDIEAMPLAEAVPEKFAQQNLFWNKIDTTTSALSIFEESFSEAKAGKVDSDLFDEGLLGTYAKLSTIFSRGIDEISIGNGKASKLIVLPKDIETILALRGQVPHPQAVKISGIINTIRHSDKMFEIVVDSGDTVRGIAVESEADHLAQLFGKRVLISGRAIFRPSGSVLRIEANRISAVGETENFWSKVPKPLSVKIDLHKFHRSQTPTSGMSKIFGKWPGAESDEEIEKVIGCSSDS